MATRLLTTAKCGVANVTTRRVITNNMNAFVLKNLRKHYDKTSEDSEVNTEEESLLRLLGKSHATVTVNINRFEKPVGAVVIPGTGNNIKDINDVIEIKKV